MSSTLHSLSTRALSTGATAGAAIGAAAAGILLIAGLVIFAMWHRKRQANNNYSRTDGNTAEKGNMARCNSCKRPQHHKNGDMPMPPQAAALKEGNVRESAYWDEETGSPRVARPWLHGNGSRASFAPSFSSRRATRMMMVM